MEFGRPHGFDECVDDSSFHLKQMREEVNTTS